jgi:hypothetical protein
MIERKVLSATQVIVCAPWEISMDALNSPAVQQSAKNTKNRVRVPRPPKVEGQSPLFSDS